MDQLVVSGVDNNIFCSTWQYIIKIQGQEQRGI